MYTYVHVKACYAHILWSYMYAGVGKDWNKSMDAFHWSSLVVRGATIDFQLFIFALFNLCRRIATDHDTYVTVFKIMHWSFYWLYQGRWPTHTWNGHRIAGRQAGTLLAEGMFCVIWNFKGDLDYFAKCLGLRHYASLQPCFFCPADCTNIGDGRPWTDFREGLSRSFAAAYSKDQWTRLFPHPNILLTLPGVSVLTCSADHMHCKHMGVDQWYFGSVLLLLVCYEMPGTSEASLPR